MRLYRLDAAVLQLAPGADPFLQAYTAQVPAAPRGAFLDARGRAVAVYDHVRIDADRSVIVVARAVADRLRKHLKNYLFLTDAALTELPHAVYCDLDGAPDAATATGREWILPRATGGALWITAQAPEASADEDAFRLFRWSSGPSWALQGIDYDDPMLLNLSDPELVSFAKGCYLGQEIVARVHYRAKPPLRMAAVTEGACPPELREKMTSRVRDPRTGETKGFVFLPND